jgi:hypothetical protein
MPPKRGDRVTTDSDELAQLLRSKRLQALASLLHQALGLLEDDR